MTVICLPSGTAGRGRCAYAAGKRLGNAPFRNRCKRVMREAARACGAPWEGHDVVFVAKRGVAHARQGKLAAKMREQLLELEVL